MLNVALLVLLLEAGSAGLAVPAVKDSRVVELLSTIRLAYDSERRAPYRLRAFAHRGDCDGVPCEHLYVSVSAFDEVPERRAFRLALPGVLARVEPITMPKAENDSFELAVRSEVPGAKRRCEVYRASLRGMVETESPCPSLGGR